MPYLLRPDGARLRYEVSGKGIPTLLIAPGGMQSSVPMWQNMPYNPHSRLDRTKFCVVAMDQRNATMDSVGPLGEGWSTYVADQLALLDHLGIDACVTVGSCIGPSYQLALMKAAPARFAAAVLMQPIGLARATTEKAPWNGDNVPQTREWFERWATGMTKSGRADSASLRALQVKMFEGEAHGDFVFSVSRSFVAGLKDTPLLVLEGKDWYHPTATSREIAELAPRAELVEAWRGAADQDRVGKRVEGFLMSAGGRLPERDAVSIASSVAAAEAASSRL